MGFLAKFIILPAAVLAGGHTVFVSYRHSQLLSSINASQSTAKDFRPGRVDDVVLDSMNSGDLVLFRKKWYYNYLPIAAYTVLYRAMLGCEFDHVGVVAVDKFGVPWLVENTPFHGMTCSRLSDRLKLSESELIAMAPLLPRPQHSRTIEDPKRLLQEHEVKETPAEMRLMMQFASSSLFSLLHLHTTPQYLCPNMTTIDKTLRLMGLNLVSSAYQSLQDSLTLRDMEERGDDLKVVPSPVRPLAWKESLHVLRYSHNYVMLRTK